MAQPETVKVEFSTGDAIRVGSVAVKEAEELFAKSAYGRIVLEIQDRVVVSSECVVKKRYGRQSP
jgi:hypothetical protein